MNLNRNPRFEQFDLDEDIEIFDFYKKFLDEIWATASPGMKWSRVETDPAFGRVFSDGQGEMPVKFLIDVGGD